VGQSSETKKLLSDQVLNFGPDSDFLEISELWSTYFDVVEKPRRRATSLQNFMGQSSETKKLLSHQFWKFGRDFLETGKLWSYILKLLERGREAVQEIKS